MTTTDRKLTLRETAQFIGVHYETVKTYYRKGKLPATTIGPKKIYVLESKLKAWIESKTQD